MSFLLIFFIMIFLIKTIFVATTRIVIRSVSFAIFLLVNITARSIIVSISVLSCVVIVTRFINS